MCLTVSFSLTSCNRNRKIDRTNTIEQKHDQVLKWRVEHHRFKPLVLAESCITHSVSVSFFILLINLTYKLFLQQNWILSLHTTCPVFEPLHWPKASWPVSGLCELVKEVRSGNLHIKLGTTHPLLIHYPVKPLNRCS